MIISRRLPLLGRPFWLLLLLLVVAAPPCHARAQGKNRLVRVGIVPHPGYTRVTLFFLEPPQYRLTRLPGGVRLTFPRTDSPTFKRLRTLSAPHLSGVRTSQHGGDLQVTIPLTGGDEARPLDCGALSLCLDIGAPSASAGAPEIVPGREPILAGTERFVWDFTPTTSAALPFAPTDPKLLHALLGQAEIPAFQGAEELLYREKGTEALEALAPFLSKGGAAKALAAYRTGEAHYLMERYDAALKSFRQGELLWPDFLTQAPSLVEQYADALARCGDYLAGRRLMGRLIAAYSGDTYQPALINRLAEMTARRGDAEAALHLYKTVARHFPGNVAAARARMKLADREMFSIPRDGLGPLLEKYREIAKDGASLPLRDEAFFKTALLQALYGDHRDALEVAASYERLYPRGIFVTIVRKMREELVYVAYREDHQESGSLHQNGGGREGLVRLALENRDYLARCFEDPRFPAALAKSFHETGQVARELELYAFLAERSFAAQAAPFLTLHLVEDGLALGKVSLAEANARSFVARFPRHEAAPRMQEILGRIAFDRGDLRETAGRLVSLAGRGGGRPVFAESDYYLGKALLAAKDHRGAERSLARFAAAAPSSPLAADAHFGRVEALAALKDSKGALEVCRQGLKGASGENADRFLYRIGELHLQRREVREAALAWEKVVKEGKEGVWRTMARESLSDLQWRLKISGELPGSSKR